MLIGAAIRAWRSLRRWYHRNARMLGFVEPRHAMRREPTARRGRSAATAEERLAMPARRSG
jgi:hypothetical protein